MTFKELQAGMIAAMKERNQAKKNVFSEIIACVKNMAIEQKCRDNITEDMVAAAILKTKKICQEQIDTCPETHTELLNSYKTNMMYINEIAPRMMTEEEVYNYINNELIKLSQVMTISPKIKGMVMKNVMSSLKGKADGKMINRVVDRLLANVKEV